MSAQVLICRRNLNQAWKWCIAQYPQSEKGNIIIQMVSVYMKVFSESRAHNAAKTGCTITEYMCLRHLHFMVILHWKFYLSVLKLLKVVSEQEWVKSRKAKKTHRTLNWSTSGMILFVCFVWVCRGKSWGGTEEESILFTYLLSGWLRC